MRKPQKPISEKRLRKMAEKFQENMLKKYKNNWDDSEWATILMFLSYVSEHKNDEL